MKLGRAILACLLAAGLALVPSVVARASGAEPWRDFVLRGPTDDVPQGAVASVEVYGWTSHPTSVRLQRRVGGGEWTYLTDPFPVLPAGNDTFVLEVPVPTDQVGRYQVRLLLDSGPDFPLVETVGPVQVSVVQAPPAVQVETEVTMSRLPDPRPRLREPMEVTGRVSGGFARTVELQVDAHRGWATVAATTSDADGRYRLTVPTDWFYAGALRVAAPAARVGDTLHRAGLTRAGGRITVAPGYRPRGRAQDWTSMYGDHRVTARWDPCQTISWRVNLQGAPGSGLATARKALSIVHAATGLRFAYAGRTDAVPFRTNRGPEFAPDTDLTIAWASPRQLELFRGRWSPIGFGGYRASSGRIEQGGLSLDRTWRARPGFGRGGTLGALLLHEIGHTMGLGHARGREQVMHPAVNASTLGRYEAGDLAGLARFGAAGGCLDAPDTLARSAPPVTVVLP